MTAAPSYMTPYQPRHVRRLGLWRAGPLQLKAYGVTVAPRSSPIPSPLHDAARRYVEEQVHLVVAEGHHGLGFVVVHEGREGTWLLFDWWAHQDICCQLLAHADTGTSEFHAVERPLLACVWESVVLNHERVAWVQTMLTADPGPQAYLDQQLPDGAY